MRRLGSSVSGEAGAAGQSVYCPKDVVCRNRQAEICVARKSSRVLLWCCGLTLTRAEPMYGCNWPYLGPRRPLCPTA